MRTRRVSCATARIPPQTMVRPLNGASCRWLRYRPLNVGMSRQSQPARGFSRCALDRFFAAFHTLSVAASKQSDGPRPLDTFGIACAAGSGQHA